MIDPTKDDIGREVIYTSLCGNTVDRGVISSFNDNYVFVRYGSSDTGIATLREDLKYK